MSVINTTGTIPNNVVTAEPVPLVLHTTTSSNTATPPAPAAAPAAPAAPAAEKSESEKPHWLDGRLERERKSLLKELGLDDVESGKKAIAELNAKREAEKTAAEKATELDAKLKASDAEKAAMAEALGATAKARMKTLSEAQQAAVAALAGDDPVKQLKTIEALVPTWASAPAATETKTVDTAPGRTAPEAGATSAPDPKAVYEQLRKTNPIAAARYAFAHGLHGE